MLELFPQGFEEVDHEGDDLELAAYASAGDEERFWQVFGPGAAVDVDGDWEDAWKRFHKPIRVGPLWVGPPWETADAGAVAVTIDPGRAFGTGGHATTRLCLELLLEQPRSDLVDLGCGSGVLAIAAAKLGFTPVTALDVDSDAVAAASANASANGVDIHVGQADIFVDPLPVAALALANVTLEAVELLAPRLETGGLIVSGYLAGERPALPEWEHVERRQEGAWAADRFTRSASYT
jgi:ribosomal protein L11 methyltransferase